MISVRRSFPEIKKAVRQWVSAQPDDKGVSRTRTLDPMNKVTCVLIARRAGIGAQSGHSTRSRRLRYGKGHPRQGLFLEAMRFEGERWQMFGELIEGGSVQE